MRTMSYFQKFLVKPGSKVRLRDIDPDFKGKHEDKKDALKYLKHACRVVSENGADIVKTYYCDGFEEVVEACLAPIVIAGGTKRPTKEALEFTYNAVKAGAIGVDMGRNIFQNENPVAMIQAVRAVVHDNMTAAQALDLYNSLKGKK